MSTAPFPLIIDTDPGVDDALAILFAHVAPDLDVRGLTTVFGNQTIDKTTRNAYAITRLLGATTPVFRGASRPLVKAQLLAECHGESGLGTYKETGLLLGSEAKDIVQQQDAIGFLGQVIKPGMRIACLGPTTNLALLANLRPEVLQQTEEIVIMGGVFDQPGNVTPWAEFNVYNDPDALAQVLALDGVKKVIIPADVCRYVTMGEQDFTSVKDQALAASIREIIREYVEYYKNDHVYGDFAGGVMYDALVIAYLLWPDLFYLEPAYVTVETGDGPARGATAVDPKKSASPNCFLVTRGKKDLPQGVDAPEVKRRLLGLLS
jgi:inosine-uridine nucleoside N-ribohydrolase